MTALSSRSPLTRRTVLAFLAIAALTPAAARAQAVAAPEAPASMAEDAPAVQTVAVAALASYDQLMKEINFLGELGGRPAASDMVEGMIAFFTGGRGVEGLDKSRPLGMVLQTDGAAFAPILCLPVADIAPLLELAENFGFEPIEAGDGVYEVELKDQTVFVRNTGAWTFVGQTAESLAQAPQDPGSSFQNLTATYDFAVSVMAQNVPDMYRRVALEQLRQGMEEGLTQEENETEEEFAERSRLAESQVEQIGELVEGLDVVTLGWSIDAEKKHTFLDAVITGVAGSDIALAMDAYKDPKSGVNGFHRPKAAMSLLTVGTTPPELLEKQKEQTEAAIAMVRGQVQKGMKEQADSGKLPDDPAVRAALEGATEDLIDVYADMLTGGRVELGGSLDLQGDGYDMVVGGYVPDPAKVESAFKKLADAAASQEGFPGVEWGYATHAGVKMHGMTIPVPEQATEAREALGESVRVVMGVGGERVYLAVGPRGEESLKRAIDESAASAEKAILPAELIVSIGQILTAAEKVAPPQAAPVIGMVLGAMEDVPPGVDRLVMTTESVDRGMRVRYLLEEGVLKAVGNAAATAAAMQQGQAGGGY